MVPVRSRNSMARSRAYSLLNQYDIIFPSVPAKELLREYCRLFYFEGTCPDSELEIGWCQFGPDGYRAYINRNLENGRDSFFYAHELGHIVLGHFEDYDVSNLNERQHLVLNREANIFATNLLMPEAWVQLYLKPPITVKEIGRLKDMFDVSWEALINRLDELSICPRHKVDQMFSERSGNKASGCFFALPK